ncbi:hypothetical protein EB235_05155 [Mesorhizobium loti R88b]|uniref:Uncharacterized protein n=1 Tax=Mesorhizobium loti R88b TaxID=935548 RepID=A0A6M7WM92_RHILI|nr:hypothetical protein EB235_05155 [Mesorhizobium loti R88b]
MRLVKTVLRKLPAPGCGLPLLPLWEKVSPKATDEGCSREHQRLTPLEHPSSVSALTRRSTFPHKGGRKGCVAAFAKRKQPS